MHVWSGRVTEFAWWIAVGVCCGWLLLSWILRRIKRHGNHLSEDEPRCARCGYIIFPGASAICPECGADVRESGLATPSTLPHGSSTPWVALAALLAWPAAGWLAPHVAERQPFGWEFSIRRWVVLGDLPVGDYPVVSVAVVHGTGTGRYGDRVTRLVEVNTHLAGHVPEPYLLVLPQEMTCHLRHGRGDGPLVLPFRREAVAILIGAAGFDPHEGPGRRAVDEIERQIWLIASADFPRSREHDVQNFPYSGSEIRYWLNYRVERNVQVATGVVFFFLAAVPIIRSNRRYWRVARAAQVATLQRMRLVVPAQVSSG